MSLVVDASIVFRLLANVKGDDLLRQRLARKLHAPALIDVEIASVVRGHAITSKPEVRISDARAQTMLERYAQLKIVRHPMLPLQRRVLELRNNLTAYDGMYVALAELLGVPLLTDDAKFAGATGHRAEIHRYPPPRCKSGNWSSWSKQAIPHAEHLYEEYLKERQIEEEQR